MNTTQLGSPHSLLSVSNLFLLLWSSHHLGSDHPKAAQLRPFVSSTHVGTTLNCYTLLWDKRPGWPLITLGSKYSDQFSSTE